MPRDVGNREKILDAAATLFHEHGFRPTSLDDILGATGVCRSNFYYHFRSKEDLGLAVLDRQTERFEAEVLHGVLGDKSLPARQRLVQMFDIIDRELGQAAYRRGCPFGNLAAELSGIHPEFRNRLSAFFRRWEEAVEGCLRDGIARGEFRDDIDTRKVATAIVSQIEGAVLLAKAHATGDPLIAGAEILLRLLESR